MAPVLSFDNPIFSQFAFYASVVIIKTLIMAPLTALSRFKYNAFGNPEDYVTVKKPSKVVVNDAVERIRRCHLNDLENVIPFVIVGPMYILTGPQAAIAALHFQIFAGARIFHSIAYLLPLPQPSRALAYVVGLIVTISMLVNVLKHATF
ncbi:hypothetical protein ScPMuIL_004478 [Solemya velum]